jgi:hypothetical protein
VTDAEKPRHWSDEKADVVAILAVFCALVAAAVFFISGS